ncbi:MAG: cofactor-independent phosphoglycerate mutase [Deltaproteobacteria bacterium CG12_big_fil_rev_8_21_14_0_65_43_10]|nr:MAG: cofactor-independent phosphoglycerate mutase [Deltaproteobacteria bacterium CG2_30_43_15]PIQ46145.1 MAG: cofactor-independent phosphoglycerate mutase [Deltaproteobacteria bacterium CG12_big_fil_rev_8_21_14_0_65_43_10]PIU85924.1 MAG: cofactor-independent phosphoglycerate mutase [Deltaproteobacteria bacterium CG06_land_8_20_14_3_00_44_19]PIX24783.1 MAG: cofactor-independent phosphoglycerate mutase [Deltaproteobacteria bacterium CG_4_8_14_3_um_filter_43_13]PIZ21142.1 MAG: cofactor-independ
MKHIILIGDGMADYPVPELGGKTPLEVADIPNMNLIVQKGKLGMVRTIPMGLHPGSDIANLSILGYDPKQYYTGRAPLEAASLGLKLGPEDVAYRCNLVTLSVKNGKKYMDDYSAGHISTEEAKEIIHEIDQKLGIKDIKFYPGVSYRHLMVWKNGQKELSTTPPHDISGKAIDSYLPKGKGEKQILQLMNDSQTILENSNLNKIRIKNYKKPANSIWLWGQGKSPKMPTLLERYRITGSVISAVDLIKGIGVYAGLEVIDVPGATGYLDTNYQGKANYALRALEKRDFVYLHVEAPDEASHSGDLKNKLIAIERFDKEVVGTVLDKINRFRDYRIMVLPDHSTPLSVMSHTPDPVPFAIFSSEDKETKPSKDMGFNEKSARINNLFIEDGYKLLPFFLRKN